VSGNLLDILAVRPTLRWLHDPWLYVAAIAALPVAIGLRALLGAAPVESVRGYGWLFGFLLWQPLIEELLFRGVVQGQLHAMRPGRGHIAGITGANLLTSALFALVHAIYHAPLWAAAVFVPSLVFGFMRDRHGSIYPGLLLHCTFNGAYVLAVTR
jgi:membrane protease YdiL (CAAX protease family)